MAGDLTERIQLAAEGADSVAADSSVPGQNAQVCSGRTEPLATAKAGLGGRRDLRPLRSGAPAPERGQQLYSLLTLRRTRAVVASRGGRLTAITIAVAYGFVALLAGYMLELGPTGASGTTIRVLTNPYSPAWWNYPALLVVTPGEVLVLPFGATVSMALVSMGVGIGMGAGLILAVRFLRSWKRTRGRPGSMSPLAGLTPAMVALLTVGACCSTSLAATGDIAAIAEASGASSTQILLNSWFLNVFQVVVLGIALVAQEQLIAVYGNLLTSPPSGTPDFPKERANLRPEVLWPVLALRMALVVAGTLWALSLVLEIAASGSGPPLAALLVGGVLQRGFLGATVVAAGLLPTTMLAVLARRGQSGFVRASRSLLFASGVSLLVGVPPPVNTWGIYGLANEVLGAGGVPASLGGVVPPGGNGVVVDLGIAGLYALLGVVAMLLALYPGRLLRGLAGQEEGGTRTPESAHQPYPHKGLNVSDSATRALEERM